jgi:glutamate/tyrosine decarboxylase-like PLP-dependent enzyme
MISDDIHLASHLFRLVQEHPTLQEFTRNLSIATFRYVPSDLSVGSVVVESYLNQLNEELLGQLQRSGEAFLSNALIGGKYALRACVVNFRTSLEDIEALPEIVSRLGRAIDAVLRPVKLKSEP